MERKKTISMMVSVLQCLRRRNLRLRGSCSGMRSTRARDLDLELGIVDGRDGEESWSTGADLRGDSSARLLGKGDGD
nr:hypothetical protein Itr_chr02CG14470 [Ipomoea trifida]